MAYRFQPQTMEDLVAPVRHSEDPHVKRPILKRNYRETVEVPGGKLFLNVKGNCIEGKLPDIVKMPCR